MTNKEIKRSFRYLLDYNDQEIIGIIELAK